MLIDFGQQKISGGIVMLACEPFISLYNVSEGAMACTRQLAAVLAVVLAVAPVEQIQQMVNSSQLAPLFDTRLIFSILGLGG